MTSKKFDIKKISTYVHLLVLGVLLLAFFWLFTFINNNVLKNLNSNETLIDPNSIKIVDVDLEKFNKVLKSIENKSARQSINPRNVFD